MRNTGIHIRLLWDEREAGSLRDLLTAGELLKGQGLRRELAAQEKAQVRKTVRV